jgi:anti-sigma factor RsiW
MHSCQSIDPLVTAYVDGEIDTAERIRVEEHLGRCASCHSRVAAERAARGLIHTRKPGLCEETAPPALRDACAKAAEAASARRPPSRLPRVGEAGAGARRWAPLALAASLVLLVGGAFIYQLTSRSTTVLAAELAADHVKCFALNRLLATQQNAAAVERAMADGFGWPAQLPEKPERMGLELVGARPCLYGEGRVAHIMYRYKGRPVSLFMLPDTVRDESVVKALGHHCAIWSEGGRTFVLVAREPRNDVNRLASLVHAGMR